MEKKAETKENKIFIDELVVPNVETLIDELRWIKSLEKEHNVSCTLSKIIINGVSSH